MKKPPADTERTSPRAAPDKLIRPVVTERQYHVEVRKCPEKGLITWAKKYRSPSPETGKSKSAMQSCGRWRTDLRIRGPIATGVAVRYGTHGLAP